MWCEKASNPKFIDMYDKILKVPVAASQNKQPQMTNDDIKTFSIFLLGTQEEESTLIK